MEQKQALTQNIFSLMDTGYEACSYIAQQFQAENYGAIPPLLQSLDQMLQKVLDTVNQMELSENFIGNIIANACDYLQSIQQRIETQDVKRACTDFVYIFYGLYMHLRQELETHLLVMCDDKSFREAIRAEFDYLDQLREAPPLQPEESYKYKVSILVPAYNSLDYTKQCVESILQYTPGIGTDCELIVRSDGSTDGVNEYVESLPIEKKLIYKHNIRLVSTIIYAAEGRYLVFVSNDVVVTTNWLENLIACAEQTERLGMVVPVTNKLANLQTIPAPYKNMREMQAFAKRFNVSDPRKWEERERLANFTFLVRSEVLQHIPLEDHGFYYGHFQDDDVSIRMRRAGYKLINARDTFVHHYGSASYSKIGAEKMALMDDYLVRKHGFTTWGSSLVTPYIAQFMDCSPIRNRAFHILCVDEGLGATGLLIKNRLITEGASQVSLYGLLLTELYLPYVESMYERVAPYRDESTLQKLCPEQLDLAVICNLGQFGSNYAAILRQIKGTIKETGELYVSFDNPMCYSNLVTLCRGGNELECWASLNSVSSRLCFHNVSRLCKEMDDMGYANIRLCTVTEQPDKHNLKSLATTLSHLSNVSADSLMDKMQIKRYVLIARMR